MHKYQFSKVIELRDVRGALSTMHFSITNNHLVLPLHEFNILFIRQDTSHHKVAILLFHGGDLVSLIIFWIKLCIVLVGNIYHWYFKVLCIYILRMNVRGK